jgi:hypothetical protein
VVQPQQRRLRTLFEMAEKRRGDIRALLDHSITLDPRHSEQLPGGDQFSPRVEELLRKRGAPDRCFVVASNARFDGREMPLREALDAVIGGGDGAFISCIPGKLGYFEFAHASGGHLLRR